MLTNLKRIFKFAWQGFWRNKGLGFGVIFIMAIAVFLVTSLFIFTKLSTSLLSQFQEKVDVSVYFKKEVSEEEILVLRDSLLEMPLNIQKIDYISKEKALEIFRARHQKDPFYLEALETVGANPFLASLGIRAPGAEDYAKIAEFLEGDDFNEIIAKISYHQDKRVIERLFSFMADIKTLGIVLAALLLILVVLLIFSTLKLTISTLKDEIVTMRLVGASNFFIQGPFVLQGFLYGIFAVLIVDAIFWLGLPLLNPKVQAWFLDVDLLALFQNNFPVILALQIGLVIILGAIASFSAIRKYLKT